MVISQVTSAKTRPSSKKATRKPAADTFRPGEIRPLQLSYLPQDQGMIPAQLGKVMADENLKNERFQLSVSSSYPQIKADAEGKVEIKDQDDPRFDSANCFFIANDTLAMAEKYAGGRIEWSFAETLGHPMLVKPHAGKDVVNAYYNNQSGSINFFSYLDEKTGERQRTGMSRDIIAHEVGHAILDGLRPNFMESLSVGGGGFHESFADMTAFLASLNDPHVVEALRVQTKGDLTKSNLLSGVGEQLGASCFEKGPLRDFVNKHKYADQAFLPYSDEKDPGTGLGTECHAYANLFNGAFYDLFLAAYTAASANPESNFQSAVAEARDQVGRLLFRAVEMGPVGDISYREAAMAFLRADLVDNGGKNQDMIKKAFLDRKILRAEDADLVKKAQEDLPSLRWNQQLADKETALEWFEANREKLGLPDDVEFEFDRLRTTQKGERFVAFSTHRDRLLEGPSFGDYEGSQIRGRGGVLLGFNEEGKLITFQYDEVSDRELEDTVAFFHTSLDRQQVMRANGEGQSLSKKAPPKLQVESVMENGHRILRRGGVI